MVWSAELKRWQVNWRAVNSPAQVIRKYKVSPAFGSVQFDYRVLTIGANCRGRFPQGEIGVLRTEASCLAAHTAWKVVASLCHTYRINMSKDKLWQTELLCALKQLATCSAHPPCGRGAGQREACVYTLGSLSVHTVQPTCTPGSLCTNWAPCVYTLCHLFVHTGQPVCTLVSLCTLRAVCVYTLSSLHVHTGQPACTPGSLCTHWAACMYTPWSLHVHTGQNACTPHEACM